MDDQEIAEILHSINTIALVGVSDKKDRPSYEVMEYLSEQGYTVIPVSPRLAGKTLLEQQVYSKLSDILNLLIWWMYFVMQQLLRV